MGLKIHTLAEIPDSVSKKYYLYILDYYNWDEPIGNTLRENFEKIAEFAANNNSVVIQGIAGSHFYSELMSWRSINGIDPLELLPALMITLKSATKPLKVLIAFTRPLITEFADNLNLKHPLLPTISPYPTM